MFVSVTRQIELARDVGASVMKLVQAVASALDPTLSSYLEEGETLDGLGAIQLTLVRWLHADHLQLENLEKAHRSAMRTLRMLRLRRDELQQPLYSGMLRIRGAFEDAFGQGKAPIFLGLEPRMGRVKPLVLARYAREAIQVLSNPDLVLPKVIVAGLWEKPAQYAEQIRTLLEPFAAVLDEIDAQEMEVEWALRAKNDLLGELKDRLKWSVRFVEALYHLAGFGFHADRLLPKVPRSTEPSNDEAEPPEDGEAEETEEAEETAQAPETAEAAPPETPAAQESPAVN